MVHPKLRPAHMDLRDIGRKLIKLQSILTDLNRHLQSKVIQRVLKQSAVVQNRLPKLVSEIEAVPPGQKGEELNQTCSALEESLDHVFDPLNAEDDLTSIAFDLESPLADKAKSLGSDIEELAGLADMSFYKIRRGL